MIHSSSNSEKLKQRLYNLGIDILAFLGKVGVVLSLPFKFIQFWGEAWKKNSKKKE